MDDHYLPLLTAPSISSEERRPPAATSPARKGRNRSTWVGSKARMVFGAYRRDEFADPENFIVQLGMILERYDDQVIEHVTSPLTGIQRKCKFPPSIAEIVEACDAEHRSRTYAAKYDQRSAKQLRERAEDEALQRAEPLEYRSIVAERMLAEYNAGVVPETKPQQWHWKQLSAEELLATYRQQSGGR
jgi:hypothetical protein